MEAVFDEQHEDLAATLPQMMLVGLRPMILVGAVQLNNLYACPAMEPDLIC
jgi:hypothetical protein